MVQQSYKREVLKFSLDPTDGHLKDDKIIGIDIDLADEMM